jgi:hypothetical protein
VESGSGEVNYWLVWLCERRGEEVQEEGKRKREEGMGVKNDQK